MFLNAYLTFADQYIDAFNYVVEIVRETVVWIKFV